MLTQQELKNSLHYDPDTGLFTWKNSTARRIVCGRPAGTKNAGGYIQIRICGRLHYAHRLAWLYMTGSWPENQIDHINTRKDDNSWPNLREARPDENLWNMGLSKHNKSGVKGVSVSASTGKLTASVCVSGKARYVGTFTDKDEAADAVSRFRKMHHGAYARDAVAAS